MKFKKILILLSIGILLLIIFNVANTINNNASTKQPVKDNNYNVKLPDYIVEDGQTVNRQNNYTDIFEQLSDFKKFKVNYANNAECTAILKIKYPDGRYSPTYYIKPGEESDLPFHYAKAGYHEVRIDSQNPHLKLDGYLTIREYN